MIILFVLSLLFSTTDDIKMDYIKKYSPVAIAEMNRTGIPASIKLAQALHESNAGASHLSLESNNHFGIKCKSYWQGSTYYHKDDDYNSDGSLINSCFRAYDTPVDSYVDHSNFIVNSINYGGLVKSCGNDYVAWARGLQRSGYATDPAYAEKLIKIVENYQLYQYD